MNNSFTGKLFIRGEIKVLTGLSIGSGGQAGIGLVDNPVIKNPLTNMPYIPGSSLKGRLRHALYVLANPQENKDQESRANEIFGEAAGTNKNKMNSSRIYVRDCDLIGDQNISKLYEIKYENSISRTTGTTTKGGLRQMERVVPGTKFSLELVYNYYSNYSSKQDLSDLRSALEFVEDEYLGGSGSRGYGKVKFHITELWWKRKEDYLDDSNEKLHKENLGDDLDWTKRANELINSCIQ